MKKRIAISIQPPLLSASLLRLILTLSQDGGYDVAQNHTPPKSHESKSSGTNSFDRIQTAVFSFHRYEQTKCIVVNRGKVIDMIAGNSSVIKLYITMCTFVPVM